MLSTRIAIVGGGLSGLYAAFRLEQAGIGDYRLFEARDGFGGRILSAPLPDALGTTSREADRFDLGPTWFWPDMQPQLDRLIHDLGLPRFAQHEAGDMVVERSRTEPPRRMRGYPTSPVSMRLVGGMDSLTDALRRRLDPARLIAGQPVRRLRRSDQGVELDAAGSSGLTPVCRAERVLLAVPPRLAEHTIAFEPSLPDALTRHWRATATWMAPHAKYLAIYDTPFWRSEGLSGDARSMVGPLGEIHDASMPGGHAALFGFFGIPAHIRRSVSEDVLRSLCRAQLARLFGPRAEAPKADFIKDWALDSHTAIPADQDGESQHAHAPPAAAASGPWQGQLAGIASEWSPGFPGYVAGAIEAASLGIQALLEARI